MEFRRTKLFIFITAPIEVIACAVMGAVLGARDGARNIRDAWASSRKPH